MKNMEMISATTFTSPIQTNITAIILVTIPAFNGSFFFDLERKVLAFMFGRTLSLPKACSVLGATMNEPNADDIVAAASPTRTNGPQRLMSAITS